MMNKITDISVVMIVKNEEAVLEGCLASLEAFAEVVVFLNGSTDGSEAVARKHPNVKLVFGEFDLEGGFAATRNTAASHATNDWIFKLDPDERLDQTALKSLGRWDLTATRSVGWLTLVYYFMGKRLRFGGARPRLFARLYNRRVARWVNRVHEGLDGENLLRLVLNGEVRHLEGSYEETRAKVTFYGQLYRSSGGRPRPLLLTLAGAFWHFVKFYVLYGGLIHGKAGLCQAYIRACAHFEKYKKT